MTHHGLHRLPVNKGPGRFWKCLSKRTSKIMIGNMTDEDGDKKSESQRRCGEILQQSGAIIPAELRAF